MKKPYKIRDERLSHTQNLSDHQKDLRNKPDSRRAIYHRQFVRINIIVNPKNEVPEIKPVGWWKKHGTVIKLIFDFLKMVIGFYSIWRMG